MQGNEFILSPKQLMILFNALDDLECRNGLSLSLPLLNNVELCRFEFMPAGVKLTHFLQKNKYLDTVPPLTEKLQPRAKAEIPKYEDIRASLFQAGILQLDGLSHFEQLVASIKMMNVLNGGDIFYIALDTNLLRTRFFSTYLRNIPAHPNLDYILCETVRDELANRCEGKISQKLLQEMKTIPFNRLSQCFLNQPPLEDRKRYIGLLEYNRMRGATGCEEIDSSSHNTSAKNDRMIIDAYSGFAGIGRKVIFLSMDNEIIMQTRGEENVIPILLEQSVTGLESLSAPWLPFFEFLYLLGVLFGEIVIRRGDVALASLWGVWRGKDAREWEGDRVKIGLVYGKNPHNEKVRQTANRAMTNDLALLNRLAGIYGAMPE